MPYYLFQAAYQSEALAKLIKKPVDRGEAIRGVLEKMGGKLIGNWFCFGDYDIVLICELPDNVSAAAFSIAAAAGGAIKSNKTTPLFSGTETLQIFKSASKTGYQPPK